ncbi:GD16430 [Drosophila simulans]|uniref:GD16430 n=1 Tax=Drosophila simulans TaxID=7240 RepID=B4R2N2_DROSI|nr:GD16430 [Drosophila simulans]
MFNSNIPASSLLSIDSGGLLMGGHTPKTPEILNSLIAMTNPLENFSYSSAAAAAAAVSVASSSASCSAASTPVVTVRHFNGHPNGQSHSQDSSHSSCSGSPLDSPAGTATTPSVQQTCSRLIKEGLKLSIQSKRKLSTCDSSSGSEQPHSKYSRRSSNHNGHSGSSIYLSGSMSNANDLDDDCEESSDDDSETKSQPKGLTPEDEDRRRRRRERNKIAATKCRMKKRERTQNLIKESEGLGHHNVELKNKCVSWETERQKLMDMLKSHGCQRAGGCQLPSQLLQSPAQKYLSELELETVSIDGPNSGNNNQRLQSIPSMATFKYGSKTAAAMAQQLPNGYCKPSPSAQEFEHAGYQQQQQQQPQSLNPAGNNVVDQQQANPSPSLLSDYVPNCDGLTGSASSHPNHNNNNSSSGASTNTSNNNSNISSHSSNATSSTTPTATSSAIEFVKNELVDSQSPYTTALSAERFLFEPSDGFPDIKHACVLPSPCGINGLNMASVVNTNGSTGNNNNSHHNNNNNNNNHLMDFSRACSMATLGPEWALASELVWEWESEWA